jgi:hypothetical protein
VRAPTERAKNAFPNLFRANALISPETAKKKIGNALEMLGERLAETLIRKALLERETRRTAHFCAMQGFSKLFIATESMGGLGRPPSSLALTAVSGGATSPQREWLRFGFRGGSASDADCKILPRVF